MEVMLPCLEPCFLDLLLSKLWHWRGNNPSVLAKTKLCGVPRGSGKTLPLFNTVPPGLGCYTSHAWTSQGWQSLLKLTCLVYLSSTSLLEAWLGSSQQFSHCPLHCPLSFLPLPGCSQHLRPDFLLAAPFSTQRNICKHTSGAASPTQPDRSRFLFGFRQDPCSLYKTDTHTHTHTHPIPYHTTLYLQSSASSFLLALSLYIPTCLKLFLPELKQDLHRPIFSIAATVFLILHSPLLPFNLVLKSYDCYSCCISMTLSFTVNVYYMLTKNYHLCYGLNCVHHPAPQKDTFES